MSVAIIDGLEMINVKHHHGQRHIISAGVRAIMMSPMGWAKAGRDLAQIQAMHDYMGLVIISLKNKYERMYTSETVGAFALYTVLIALFTNPVIDAIKNVVG